MLNENTPPQPPRPLRSSEVPWSAWADVPRFAVRYRHLSLAALGEAYRVGVAIEELAPGKQSSPAHWHVFEEEHLYILEGSLTLRIGAARHRMTAGDYVCFPAGQQAGHCLVNDSGAPCRYVVVGEHNPNEVSVYTDSNKVLVRALGRRALFDMAAKRGYWDGEDTGLPAGAAPPESVPPGGGSETTPFPPISSRDVEWNEWQLGRGFVDRNKHLTYAAVGENYRVGVLIEGPPPGMRCAPRHYHMLEEEHALILDGEVTLLLDDERHVMKPGDYVCFPAGLAVGHSFLNSGSGPCSYLMIGEHSPHDVCVMPDSNKMVVRALGRERAIFDMAGVRDYLDGEDIG
jgi:uncharacterized cupin superfamily protein